MIELVLLVCLLSEPDKCHKEWPMFESSNANIMSCMRQGQFIAVRWEQDHPQYTVRRWTCGPTQS